MDNIENYIRVGTDYFKIIYVPMWLNNEWTAVKKLAKWNISTIKMDFPKDAIREIQLYDTHQDLPSDLEILYKQLFPRKFKQRV